MALATATSQMVGKAVGECSCGGGSHLMISAALSEGGFWPGQTVMVNIVPEPNF